MNLWVFIAAFLSLTVSINPSGYGSAQNPSKSNSDMLTDKRLDGLVAAPEFPDNLEWLNTASPIALRSLRGKLILLDFWTFCCINCMHVLPDLKKLEAKYPNELAVIGVHSAKFINEKSSESIRQAILRYEIKHPVLNDKDLEVWQQYAVRAWPTLVLINPNGRIIGVHSGEGAFDVFDPVIGQAVTYFEQKGQLKRSPFTPELEEVKKPKTSLNFPGKISADAKSGRLVIADSNHNRILLTNDNGKVLEIIGSGKQGKADGNFDEAEFHHPQGIFLENDLIYIADTENHMIRTADLKTRKVSTLFGTGEQAKKYNFSGKGLSAALNSPWDLLVHEDKLFIAMAGAHQIYSADLKTQEIKPYAGSGREAREDGLLLSAALAQPSGITTDGKKLYFADSEVSSVRSADLDTQGSVETLIGEHLFEFGDIDGDRNTARLQHALGVVYHQGILYVADTYNSKIKVIDPAKKTSMTFAGTGKHGLSDGEKRQAEFFEPGGLAVLGERLFVADTNNHMIRTIDLVSGQVKTFEISGLDKKPENHSAKEKGRLITMPIQQVSQGDGTLKLDVYLPEGYKLTPGVSPQLLWKSSDEKIISFKKSANDFSSIQFPIKVEFKAGQGKAVISTEAVIYYCRKDATLCFFDQMTVTAPVEIVSSGANRAINIDLEVKLKDPKRA